MGLIGNEIRLFKKNAELFVLTLPALIYKFIFSYLPMVGIILAFKAFRYDKGIFGSPWSGFDNFRLLFTTTVGWRLLRNTLAYNAVFILSGTALAIVLAVLMNEIRSRGGTKIVQTCLILPRFLSWVVVSYATYAILQHQGGFLNQFLVRLGVSPVKWYFERQYWPPILVFVEWWKGLGFSSLVYYVGIRGIDPSLFEAAAMEGANRWQKTWYVTLPQIAPLITILMILAIGRILDADFGLFFFVPRDSSALYEVTDVIDTYIYRSMRVLGEVGVPAALGLFKNGIGLILIIGANAVVRRISPENAFF